MTEAEKGRGVSSVVTKVNFPSGADLPQFTNRLVELLMSGARSKGFWSGEIISPSGSESEWQLIQRFDGNEYASGWLASPSRAEAVAKLQATANGTPIQVQDQLSPDTSADVASAIVTDVRPGMMDSYFEWEAKIQSAQAKFPGYRGTYLQPPAEGGSDKWATLLRFDTPESLEKWFKSDERQKLLQESNEFVKSTKIRSVTSAFPGWFPVDEAGDPPPNWKGSMLVLLGLYPVVMLEIKFLSPVMASMDPAVSGFLNLILSVCATTWGTTPVFVKLFGWWMFPKGGHVASINIKGIAILCVLYAIEIAIFSSVFQK